MVNNAENKIPDGNKVNDKNNSTKDNNSILGNKTSNKDVQNTDDLTAAEASTPVNFKGEVTEVIDGGSVKYIRVKVTESDSSKFMPGNIITVNTFRNHKVNDLVEGSGIFGENSLTNINLK